MAAPVRDQIAEAPGSGQLPGGRLLRGAMRLARRKPLGAGALVFLLLLGATATFAEPLSTHDPYAMHAATRHSGPTATHWFGTDFNGRDIYSRFLQGARIAVLVAFSAIALGTTAGAAVGLSSGYVGGKYDLAVQRVVDSIIAMPNLIVALVWVGLFGRSIANVVLVIALVTLPSSARLVRGMTLEVKGRDFIEAARAMGATSSRIVLRHIFPQVIPLIIIAASSTLGTAVLVEASLSFLGLGPAPPTPTWGSMLSGRALEHITRAPWGIIFPGLGLTLTVLAVNLLGDALRDVLDPRLK